MDLFRPSKGSRNSDESLATSEDVHTERLDFPTNIQDVYTQLLGSAQPDVPPKLAKVVHPFEWPSTRKNVIMTIAVATTIFASVAPAAYSPAEEQLASEWRISKVAAAVGVPAFTWGFASAPMVLAPLSELNGRKPVFVSTGIVYVICTLCCALTRIYAGMIVARFFSGMGCCAFSTMIAGLVADMYPRENRNIPMALFSGGAVFGIGLGPLIGGFIAQYTTWRWIFYIQVIVNGVLVLFFFLFVDESRSDVILRKHAKELNEWEARRIAQIVEHGSEVKNGKRRRIKWEPTAPKLDFKQMMKTSTTRPFQLLFTEPVVFVFSLWAAFSWAVLYVSLSVVPLIYMDIYNFSLSEANAIFTASCIGAALATLVGIYQEPLALRKGWLPPTPEARLYFCTVEAWLIPIGLFIFGWTSMPSIHWIVPAIGIALSTMGIFFVYLAVFNYLADNYGAFASSAIAAQSFCRNALGGVMPLFSQQMYKAMTYGGASSLLGGVAALLSITPLVLMFKGQAIREKSKFAAAIEEKR